MVFSLTIFWLIVGIGLLIERQRNNRGTAHSSRGGNGVKQRHW